MLLIILLCMSFSASAQEIHVKEIKKNFGFVHEGDTVKLEYELKNTGDQPLIISGYDVECGCTVMQKVEKPIQPGESYTVKVTFDTHEKYDRQDRIVKVLSNAKNGPVELRFKGVVLKPRKK